jgi:hypothetical protein
MSGCGEFVEVEVEGEADVSLALAFCRLGVVGSRKVTFGEEDRAGVVPPLDIAAGGPGKGEGLRCLCRGSSK